MKTYRGGRGILMACLRGRPRFPFPWSSVCIEELDLWPHGELLLELEIVEPETGSNLKPFPWGCDSCTLQFPGERGSNGGGDEGVVNRLGL